jgi:hypothetical protein
LAASSLAFDARELHELDATLGAELARRAPEVPCDGRGAQPELVADTLVRVAERREAERLTLALAQRPGGERLVGASA